MSTYSLVLPIRGNAQLLRRYILFLCLVTFLILSLISCGSALPFNYNVTSIIPNELKAPNRNPNKSKFDHSKFSNNAAAHVINDRGHVAGLYKYPPPSKVKIFIFADSKLFLYDSPCRGLLKLTSITNTELIAGYCQYAWTSTYPDSKFLPYSFILSYAQRNELKPVKVDWPTENFILLSMNDNGDAVGLNSKSFGRGSKEEEILGFIYTNKHLYMIDKKYGYSSSLLNLTINAQGLVVGGAEGTVVDQKTGGFLRKSHPLQFSNGEFSEIYNLEGKISGLNDIGHIVSSVSTKFQIDDGKIRSVNCEMESCRVYGINDMDWVVGYRSNSYPIPPMGASIGHTYLWIKDIFYNLDSALGLDINKDTPTKINNNGQIFVHADHWPYLITPEIGKRNLNR